MPSGDQWSSRIGADVNDARLVTGPPAEQAAASIGARAFTVGDRVFFGAGYGPSTDGGRLLEHELVHVAQQRGTRLPGSLDALPFTAPDDPLETEAHRHGMPSSAPRAIVARDPVPDLDTAMQGVKQLEAQQRAIRTAVEQVLTEVSQQSDLDLADAMAAAVRTSLAGEDAAEVARGVKQARIIAGLTEDVDIPPAGHVTFDIPLLLAMLDDLHRNVGGGLPGVKSSAGLREVIRLIAGDTSMAVMAALQGGASASLWVQGVRRDILLAASATRDATALLRLELEGTISELVSLREEFATAKDQEARARAGSALGETSRAALLLNDRLLSATQRITGPGPTPLDTAVEQRAGDIARIRQTAATEAATKQALDDRLSLLGEQQVTIRHGETATEPVVPIGEHAENVVLPEEALPETTDAAERAFAAQLTTRLRQQRSEVAELRARVVPDTPAYTLQEFADVHRRWWGLYSQAQERQHPTVQLVLAMMGEPYSMMGMDVGGAALQAEGGIARSYLMSLAVNLLSSSLAGETTQFGGQLRAARLARAAETSGTASRPGYEYGEMYPGGPGSSAPTPGRAGEVGSRRGYRERRQQETATAFGVVAALPEPLQPAAAQERGLTKDQAVPLVGMRSVRAREGWSYLVDVVSGPEGVIVAREHKVVSPDVAEYLLAALQQQQTLAAAHIPIAAGKALGAGSTRSGGVEEATATSAARLVRGEDKPSIAGEVKALGSELRTARDVTGVQPGRPAPGPERLIAALEGDLRAYLDAFFAERQSVEYRLAAIFHIGNVEHAVGSQLMALLDPGNLAVMIAEAVKISAIMTALQALGPLGELAAAGYHAYLGSHGVSNVAALISVAAFCRNAAGADNLNQARAWGYMTSYIADDAGQLFQTIVSTPVTTGLHAIVEAAARPKTPRELADAVRPLMSDRVSRERLMTELNIRIAEREAQAKERSDPDLESLKAFRDSLLGRSTAETGPAAEGAIPGAKTEPAGAELFTGRKARTETDRAALRRQLRELSGVVPVVESDAVGGTGVHVRYGDDGKVRLEIGRDVEPEHIRRHLETVRELRRYEGAIGHIRRLLSRIRQLFDEGYRAYGTEGFEARLEAKKLRAIITELEAQLRGVEARSDRLTSGEGIDAAREGESIRREIESLERQLARHEQNVDSYEKGRGFVAAEDTSAAATAAREHAQTLIERAKKAAPGVRAALEHAVTGQGGRLAGLEYEVKSEESLARKILDRAAERGAPTSDRLAAAAGRMNDVLRYTVVVDDATYMNAYRDVRTAMESAGYAFERAGNAWAEPRRFGGAYRGINATFKTPEGLEFELQFHTEKSLAMKEELHVMYEEWRDPATPAARKKGLLDEMARRWGAVPVPPGSDVPEARPRRPAGGGKP